MDKISSVSLVNLILHADIVVQLVMLLLVIASIWSWAIIFDKLVKFRILKNRSDKFEEFFESNKMLEEIYSQTKDNDNHPLARIFVSGIGEWKSNNVKQIIADGTDKKSALKERLANVMRVSSNRSMQKMESGLNFLAITGSSTPFIGLFGTVWGIMNSFQGIAISKNTSLAVVAPGIAEALLATAFGLFAAIPAVFFYNIFSARINHFTERAENFSLQLLNILSKELDR
ncbi:MAG: protein TolQ [Alphaproteobacteria bacterium RIFCSPLOWO2_01_FULL_40_26]|nr:MAG: protein TolQ [Alphaproteobacteria bacterium RIFCSPHIGHO2_02_FULL_40_34]OFW93897.1 MAG: protein TolQ [Alphaproteobacteria bacterium RIFCSPLOWO2_01_FULL_40_26]OFX09931.1 MAG: protein TolQ [Alphaproteobacteria bacterium RIFCSPLOWO2_02_FULL_40_19]OFX11482.1 MAG: protein TolQ [Alphaproteobacteria bacterium RIFCSPLOWO2_12_FULL_40_11]